jgi:transposase
VAEQAATVAEQGQVIAKQSRTITEQANTIREQVAVIARHSEALKEQEQKLEAVLAQMQTLERRVFGPKGEKMPPVEKELRREESEEDVEARRLAALAKRKAREALKQKLAKQTVIHHVSDEQRECPSCGGTASGPVGEGKRTTIYEYVPGYFVRQEHVQEKVACHCGGYIATADPPHKVVDKGQYGPGFIAHLCVMKCADSIPLYRLAKQYQRLGISMSRSTLTDLFHAAAEKLAPLYERMLALVARSDVVQADETPMKMQKPNRRGFVWTFLDEELIVYRFSSSRSGNTPLAVLGGTAGTLVVDAYTGYNRVTDVDGRSRSGCLAHVRRKFFDALPMPQAKQALALILDVYRVEHEARVRNIVRTVEHRLLRQTAGKDAMARLRHWLDEEQPKHAPKTPLGAAIGYALNQWETLMRFLDDERIPLDNNASERALRVVALGRKNFLFVGDEDTGANLAGLYSLVATCEAHDVDPIEYLKNVLLQVDIHPAKQIDDLLPHRWTPPLRIDLS